MLLREGTTDKALFTHDFLLGFVFFMVCSRFGSYLGVFCQRREQAWSNWANRRGPVARFYDYDLSLEYISLSLFWSRAIFSRISDTPSSMFMIPPDETGSGIFKN